MSKSPATLTESQLHLAVEQLRTEHSNTLDLYKAVAALLFFQYDSTPTTNRMYQLVRKGSMSAPAEALRLFWQELRERSQVRMEQADIPQNLKQSAGSLIAQLWEEGLAQARQITEQNNQQIYTTLALAEKAETVALDESKKIQSALLSAQQQLQKQDEVIDNLKEKTQQFLLHIAAQEQKIQNAEESKETLRKQHEHALLAQKEQIALSEQRTADMETYARLEIERARQETAKLQKQAQAQSDQQAKQYSALQSQWQTLQDDHLLLQQKNRYLAMQVEDVSLQHQQLEQKNQELHDLLSKLEAHSVPAIKTKTKRPSRLAQLRNEMFR